MTRLEEAYEVLSSQVLKKAYDQQLLEPELRGQLAKESSVVPGSCLEPRDHENIP